MTASPRPDLEQAGEVKFGQVGIATLRIRDWGVTQLVSEMRDRVERAPGLFERAAFIIDLGSLGSCPELNDARELIAGLRAAGVRPVALAVGTTEIDRLARELDLPLLAKFRAQYEGRDKHARDAPSPHCPPEPVVAPQIETPSSPSLVIDHPVRSGQQVYAQGRDLTVCAAVGAGAEVIADGSVHVWGPLRGRALAGAQGDANARIFCREFYAELVAIAGQYKLMEEVPAKLRGRAVGIALSEGRLHFSEIG